MHPIKLCIEQRQTDLINGIDFLMLLDTRNKAWLGKFMECFGEQSINFMILQKNTLILWRNIFFMIII